MIPKQYPGRVTRKTKALRLLWVIVSCLLFRPFPTRLFWPWRRLLLCAFGARVHREANVYSSAEIWAPWNLEMERGACLGPHTVCYNQALVRLDQCATVSQHHIYGFLFTRSLPFALADPVRRKRIEFPEEFNSLDDEEYMIIAVPAFLKRTNMEFDEGIHEAKKLPLKNPWIFTSGGVLLPEVAMRTLEVFGFCPLEVYGSTETSGIAYRQRTKDGDEWTPFDNAKIWADKDDGCLTIISPYIKNPEGFKTGDLVDIHEDGRFILKGRADSIVKIEEKRISVGEVENRIGQTGLVADCCVVPMSDRRQYLAAAIVLNKDGQEKFRGMDKFDINKFFHDYLLQYFENVVIPKKYRYLDKIPCDVQGKKHKPEIQSLFSGEK